MYLVKGHDEKLFELVGKKLSKGKTVEEIADALEESVETIEEIITGLDFVK